MNISNTQFKYLNKVQKTQYLDQLKRKLRHNKIFLNKAMTELESLKELYADIQDYFSTQRQETSNKFYSGDRDEWDHTKSLASLQALELELAQEKLMAIDIEQESGQIAGEILRLRKKKKHVKKLNMNLLQRVHAKMMWKSKNKSAKTVYIPPKVQIRKMKSSFVKKLAPIKSSSLLEKQKNKRRYETKESNFE